MSSTKFILGLFDDPDVMMHGIDKLQKNSKQQRRTGPEILKIKDTQRIPPALALVILYH